MRSKDILKEALKNYDGTLVLVSHDREFLDGLCNKVFEFNSGRIREFPGGIFEFLQSRKLEHLKQLDAQNKKVDTIKKEHTQAPLINDKEKKQLQNKIRKQEDEIARIEAEISTIETALADPTIYSNKDESAQLLVKHQKANAQLEALMTDWEDSQRQLDQLK
jgi:ATP-binding cassette subfamily F protein 3